MPLPPTAAHSLGTPSDWIVRWSHLLAPHSTVLDVACGSGRHLHYLAGLGHRVWGVDRDTAAARNLVPAAQLVEADIENGPWPLDTADGPRRFDALVVTNYLWRPLLPTLLRSLAPGGLLLYETFAAGHETLGRPSRPDFLLQPGELLRSCADWQIVAYENGALAQPARCVQRIAAFAPALPTAQGKGFVHYAL